MKETFCSGPIVLILSLLYLTSTSNHHGPFAATSAFTHVSSSPANNPPISPAVPFPFRVVGGGASSRSSGRIHALPYGSVGGGGGDGGDNDRSNSNNTAVYAAAAPTTAGAPPLPSGFSYDDEDEYMNEIDGSIVADSSYYAPEVNKWTTLMTDGTSKN